MWQLHSVFGNQGKGDRNKISVIRTFFSTYLKLLEVRPTYTFSWQLLEIMNLLHPSSDGLCEYIYIYIQRHIKEISNKVLVQNAKKWTPLLTSCTCDILSTWALWCLKLFFYEYFDWILHYMICSLVSKKVSNEIFNSMRE